MKKVNWLYIAVGVLVLFVVYKYIMGREWYLDFGSEQTANASGSKCKCCKCVMSPNWTQHGLACDGTTCEQGGSHCTEVPCRRSNFKR